MENHPDFVQKLKELRSQIKMFFVIIKSADKETKIKHHDYLVKLKTLHKELGKALNLYTIPDWIKNANCKPNEIPKSVKNFNNARPHEILRVKVEKIFTHKKDFETFLRNGYGIDLTWDKATPHFNVGSKYNLEHINGEYRIYKRLSKEKAPLGEDRFVQILKEYNGLKRLILDDKLKDNVRHLQDVEKAKKYLEKLEEIMKEDKGGLTDYFYKIFNNDLREKYEDEFNDAVKDWQDGSMLQDAKRDIEKAYANVSESKEDGFDINQEPEPLDSQKDNSHLEDFSDLPLTLTGDDDENDVAMNDIQQGETGDCYMLAAAASLAKVAPHLLTGDNGLIQDKGDYIQVRLYVKSSKFEYEYEPVIIKVSKNVLVDENNKPLNQKLGDGELWAVALEKALAQYRGGYDNIVGGFLDQGLGMLTGKRSKRFDFKAAGEKDTLTFLNECIEKGFPVTFGTKGEGKAEAEKQITVQEEQQILLEKHTYALDKIEGSLIYLYNPQGSRHLKIGFDVLEEYFKCIYNTEL